MVFISPDHKAFLLWRVFFGGGGWLTSHEFLDEVVFHPWYNSGQPGFPSGHLAWINTPSQFLLASIPQHKLHLQGSKFDNLGDRSKPIIDSPNIHICPLISPNRTLSIPPQKKINPDLFIAGFYPPAVKIVKIASDLGAGPVFSGPKAYPCIEYLPPFEPRKKKILLLCIILLV